MLSYSHFYHLFLHSILSRVVLLCISIVSSHLVPSFDKSADLLFVYSFIFHIVYRCNYKMNVIQIHQQHQLQKHV